MSLQDCGKVIYNDLGDFVDPEHEYEVEDYTEPPQRYTAGLFYPICIGDVLLHTYRIVHKLGHGEFATVWLARDIKNEKDVTLKIMIRGNEDEYNMQQEIMRTVPVQDTSNFLTYLTTFSLTVCNCYHRVLVFPVWGPSLSPPLLEQLSMASRMSAARQLLKALESLHNAGFVHHDLNEENVMWGIDRLDTFNTQSKYMYVGRPKKIALPLNLWKHGELVKPLQVPKGFLRDTVYLGGFGMAAKAGTDVKHKVLSPMDIPFHAPERFHNININPSFASDMWSYMCLFALLYLGFNPWYSTSDVLLIDRMVKTLGPLPKQWKGQYNNAYGKCNKSWYDQRRKPDPKETLEKIIEERRPEASPIERSHILSIMSKGFCYSSEGRLTATELLQDASFKAVMEIYCC
ncbi:Protein kinase-like domain containing protein [Elaphomyces granulatus]